MIKGKGFVMFGSVEEAKKASPCEEFPFITEGEKEEVFRRYFGDIEMQLKKWASNDAYSFFILIYFSLRIVFYTILL